MNVNTMDKINLYFDQKATGSTKSVEEYLGTWAAVCQTVSNVDGIVIPPEAKLSTLLKPRTIQKNASTYYSLREGRFVCGNWSLVTKTNMPCAVQVKEAEALSARAANLYGGWFSPTPQQDWADLYIKVLSEYEGYILAECTNNPESLKVLLSLYQKDTGSGL
jgi:hypothetical protein